MGQLIAKLKTHNRVVARQQCWTSNTEIRGKRTGARWPAFRFGFRRNGVKHISLKPEEADLAGFHTMIVNQSVSLAEAENMLAQEPERTSSTDDLTSESARDSNSSLAGNSLDEVEGMMAWRDDILNRVISATVAEIIFAEVKDDSGCEEP